LENRLHGCATRLEVEITQQQFFEHCLHEADLTISGLRQEKEHMVIQHSRATNNLRQRISVIEELVTSPAPAMSMSLNSTSYTDNSSSLDQSNLNATYRENRIRGESDWELITGDQQPSGATMQSA
jgi:hypothetical protein